MAEEDDGLAAFVLSSYSDGAWARRTMTNFVRSLGGVELRDTVSDDIELMRQWRSSPEISRFMHTSGPISPEDQGRWWVRVSCDPSFRYWTIWFREQRVGAANLADIEDRDCCRVGLYVGEADARALGVGAAAEFLALERVFRELEIELLRTEVFVANQSAMDLHRGFGFELEGVLRGESEGSGERGDAAEFTLRRERWNEIRRSLWNRLSRRDDHFAEDPAQSG